LTGKFFASCVVLSSHEDALAWSEIYQYVHDLGVKPSYHMGDGAKAISKAGRDVFGDLERCHRLMCWSHVHRAISPQLKSVGSHDKTLATNILNDIMDLQWSVLNEETFRRVYSLLEQKYLEKYSPDINASIAKFFSYMRKVWINSEEFRWYEGAHPWQVSNNQGLEGKNKAIQESHTFRRRLALGELFDVMLRMVKEWSEEDDVLLNSSRLATLHNQRDSLKLRTEGYQWFRRNRTSLMLKINPKGKYLVSESEEFLLGKVDAIWAVDRSDNKSDRSLKERAKERIRERESPSSSTFDDYIAVRSSCWLIEERNGDFYCDCPPAMKAKLCCHTTGMQYKEGYMEPTSDVRAVPLGEKRRKGRPKNLPSNCLAPSPVHARRPQEILDVDEREDVPAPVRKTTKRKRTVPEEVDDAENTDQVAQSPVQVLQTQFRIHSGLGDPKPPKKKKKTGREPNPSSSSPADSISTISSESSAKKPAPVICKKKKGACKHIVAFGDHYNETAWKKYADHVKSLTSMTEVDPDYNP
jgi:hypothetical protein